MKEENNRKRKYVFFDTKASMKVDIIPRKMRFQETKSSPTSLIHSFMI